MTNDILEQLAEDYFRHIGYFTQHNVKYKPNKKGPAYAVHSDVDIIGVHPQKRGIGRVIVVSCKSWHGGLGINKELRKIKQDEVKTCRTFREICMPVWSEALRAKVKELTGNNNFIFYLVVTKIRGDKNDWENFLPFNKNLKGCKIKLIDMESMVNEVWGSIKSITPAHSELSRLLQMIHHSGGEINYIYKKKKKLIKN